MMFIHDSTLTSNIVPGKVSIRCDLETNTNTTKASSQNYWNNTGPEIYWEKQETAARQNEKAADFSLTEKTV